MATMYVNKAELEISGRKKPRNFPKGALRSGLIDLLLHLVNEDQQSQRVIQGLFDRGRVNSVTDTHTSPYLGQRTSRITYLFCRSNLFPSKSSFQDRKVILKAFGKTTVISGITVKANINIDMVFTTIPPADIENLLRSNPEWFCGEISDLQSNTVPSPKIKKAA